MEPQTVRRACNCLKALANETRLAIVWLLRDGESNVNDLASQLDVSLSNISQHLRILRDRDILVARKAGNQVFYSLNDRRILRIVETLRDLHCTPSAT
jgi:ArsR family transcriptional regulator